MSESQQLEYAYLAGGCFWCMEAAYLRVPGVVEVVNGYMGGSKQNPGYEEVCGGGTGHAETIRVGYDPSRLGYADILELFWKLHDPTTLDRQGADLGEQYRSVIFFVDEGQKSTAEGSLRSAQNDFASPIVTELVQASRFWPAEDYHQQYFDLHPNAAYCRAVIAPKLRKAGLSAQPL
ncbi:MAG TPA: peptide-methionine (S)-S-oxide reductase MsrA [Rectinemataceae bacterium]|nr:peptide-methionine (S)-S-oxide reductase MsrA [Rectinemataceae bacterium]